VPGEGVDLAGVHDWANGRQGGANAEEYRAQLVADGLAEAVADERIALIGKLYEQCPEIRKEAQAHYFDRLYRSESQTRFTTKPSAFLAAMIQDLKPGKALDVAMGQGATRSTWPRRAGT